MPEHYASPPPEGHQSSFANELASWAKPIPYESRPLPPGTNPPDESWREDPDLVRLDQEVNQQIAEGTHEARVARLREQQQGEEETAESNDYVLSSAEEIEALARRTTPAGFVILNTFSKDTDPLPQIDALYHFYGLGGPGEVLAQDKVSKLRKRNLNQSFSGQLTLRGQTVELITDKHWNPESEKYDFHVRAKRLSG
jgi:hypothetical protein